MKPAYTQDSHHGAGARAPTPQGLVQALTPLLVDVASPIALYYILHAQQAVGMVNLPIAIIVGGLCLLSGPLGANSLHRLVREQIGTQDRRPAFVPAGGMG
ncbi:MAG: hypothetical protein ACR2IP_02400 [Solirubrobacteraceae bacterium]